MQNDKTSNKIPTIGVTTKKRHTDEGRYPLYTNRVAPNLRWGDEFLIIPPRSDSEDGQPLTTKKIPQSGDFKL